MSGVEDIVTILSIGVSLIFSVALVWYMCRSAFNWKKVGALAAFVFISAFIFYWLSDHSIPDFDPFAITCKSYGQVIKDCNGWLFTTKSSQDLAESIRTLLTNSSIAKGQAMIASAFVVMLTLKDYGKGVLKGGIQPLLAVTAAMIVTFLILSNISEIQTRLNYFTDFLVSFGRYDHEEAYNKLDNTFTILRNLKIKFEAFGALKIESETAGQYIGQTLSFFLELIFGCLSYANVILFSVQSILLTFIPSTLALSFFTADYDVRQPIRIILYGESARIFIVGQMGAISQLNITDNFGELTTNSLNVWLGACGSIAVAFACLVLTLVGMVVYISKLVFNEVLKDRAKEFV
ncbi:MAG: hypothetical protein EOP10_19615 [Proteobacteria bacterium]|nr:MAG: hypothetical protein EOP10_19615 [Pseudomonadota bacterium]